MIIAAVVVSLALGVLAPRDVDLVRPPDPVSKLGWMAGCWVRSSPRATIEEQWMRPMAGTLLGAGRTTRHLPAGDSVTEFEFNRIFVKGGKLVLDANPSGQEPAVFTATQQTDSSVVFSNPSHDFPQNVRYARGKADSLYAQVDGRVKGVVQKIQFRYGRRRCES